MNDLLRIISECKRQKAGALHAAATAVAAAQSEKQDKRDKETQKINRLAILIARKDQHRSATAEYTAAAKIIVAQAEAKRKKDKADALDSSAISRKTDDAANAAKKISDAADAKKTNEVEREATGNPAKANADDFRKAKAGADEAATKASRILAEELQLHEKRLKEGREHKPINAKRLTSVLRDKNTRDLEARFLKEVSTLRRNRRRLKELEKAFEESGACTDLESREWAKLVADLSQPLPPRITNRNQRALRKIFRRLGVPEFHNVVRQITDVRAATRRKAEIARRLSLLPFATESEIREWTKLIVDSSSGRSAGTLGDDGLRKVCDQYARAHSERFLNESRQEHAKRNKIARIELALRKRDLGSEAQCREWAKRITDLSERPPGEISHSDRTKLETTLREFGASDEIAGEITRTRKTQLTRVDAEQCLSRLTFLTENEVRDWGKLIAGSRESRDLDQAGELPIKLRELRNKLHSEIAATIRGLRTGIDRDDVPQQRLQDLLKNLVCKTDVWEWKSLRDITPRPAIRPLDNAVETLPPAVRVHVGSGDAFDSANEQFTIRDAQIVFVPRHAADPVASAMLESWCQQERIPFFHCEPDDNKLLEDGAIIRLLAWNRKAHATALAIRDQLQWQLGLATIDTGICDALIKRASELAAPKLPVLLQDYRKLLIDEIEAYSETVIADRKKYTDEFMESLKAECDEPNTLFIEQATTEPVVATENDSYRLNAIKISTLKSTIDEKCKGELPSHPHRFWEHLTSDIIVPEIDRITALHQMQKLSEVVKKQPYPQTEDISNLTKKSLLKSLRTKDRQEDSPTAAQQKSGATLASPTIVWQFWQFICNWFKPRQSNSTAADDRRTTRLPADKPAPEWPVPKEASWKNVQATGWSAKVFLPLLQQSLTMPSKAVAAIFILFASFKLVGIDNPLQTHVKSIGSGVQLDLSLTLLCGGLLLYFTVAFVFSVRLIMHLAHYEKDSRTITALVARCLCWIVPPAALGLSFWLVWLIYSSLCASLPSWRLASTQEIADSASVANSGRIFVNATTGIRDLLTKMRGVVKLRLNTDLKTIRNDRARTQMHNKLHTADYADYIAKLQHYYNTHITKSGNDLNLSAELVEPLKDLKNDTMLRQLSRRLYDYTDDNTNESIYKAVNNIVRVGLNITTNDIDFGWSHDGEDEIRLAKHLMAANDLPGAKSRELEIALDSRPATRAVRANRDLYDIGPFMATEISLKKDSKAVLNEGAILFRQSLLWIALTLLVLAMIAVGGACYSQAFWFRVALFVLFWLCLSFSLSGLLFWRFANVVADNDEAIAYQWLRDAGSDNSQMQSVLFPSLTEPADSSFATWQPPASTATLGLLTDSYHLADDKAVRLPGEPLKQSPVGTIAAVLALYVATLVFFFVARWRYQEARQRKLTEANRGAKSELFKTTEKEINEARDQWQEDWKQATSNWIDLACHQLESALQRRREVDEELRRHQTVAVSDRRSLLLKRQSDLTACEGLVTKVISTSVDLRQSAAAHIFPRG